MLGVEFTKDEATATATIGTVTLYVDDRAVGELKKVKTQLGKFALAGEGLNIGRDGGAPVTEDYPGDRPWAFSGGKISRVIVDVAGEAYVDLEEEAIAMMNGDSGADAGGSRARCQEARQCRDAVWDAVLDRCSTAGATTSHRSCRSRQPRLQPSLRTSTPSCTRTTATQSSTARGSCKIASDPTAHLVSRENHISATPQSARHAALRSPAGRPAAPLCGHDVCRAPSVENGVGTLTGQGARCRRPRGPYRAPARRTR